MRLTLLDHLLTLVIVIAAAACGVYLWLWPLLVATVDAAMRFNRGVL
jgi:hypothetical protein